MTRITNHIIFIKRFLANLWSHSVGLRRKLNRDINSKKPIKTKDHSGKTSQIVDKTSQIETEGSIKLKMNLNIKLKV